MKISGQDFIDIIVNRLTDLDIRCYDSAIVRQLSNLTSEELSAIITFGGLHSWNNERIAKKPLPNVSPTQSGFIERTEL